MNEREQLIKLIDDKLMEHLTFKDLPAVLADHIIKNGFAEVKHGEWVRVADTYGKEYLCSACKEGIRQYIGQLYCSKCGAKMDGG